MVRVHERHGSAAPSAAVLHRRAAPKEKPSYQVIFEEIGGKQKKLKTLLHTKAKAPEGYTFIPAGDPQLTNRCKQIAKDEGLTVYIVSTSTNPHKALSRETHRVGYHFPSVTVEKACDSLGVSLTTSGRVLESHLATLDESKARTRNTNRQPAKKKQKSGGPNELPMFDIQALSQAVIDTQAREAIKDLFPNIPSDDLHVVVGRSFQKGQGLVGTADGMTLVRRAQLAVIAHIRHVYTDYDRMLKQGTWHEARQHVEQLCLDKLLQWRGDEADVNNVDEMLREVIVIPDNEDEEDDQIQGQPSSLHERFKPTTGVEIVSAEDLYSQPIDYANAYRPGGQGKLDSPNSDDGEVVEFLGRGPLNYTHQVQYNEHRQNQMDAERSRRWEQARNRRRKAPETICITNDGPIFSANREMRESPSYSIQVDYEQAYKPEPRHQVAEASSFQASRAPVYTQLIPLPREIERKYIVSPQERGQEMSEGLSNQVLLQAGHTESMQVVFPAPQYRSPPTRKFTELSRVYHTNEPQPPPSGSHQSDMLRPPHTVAEQTTRLARTHDSIHDTRDALYVNSFEHHARRHSESILPSIEGDTRPEAQHSFLNAHSQRINPFALGEVTNHEMLPKFVSSRDTLGTHEGPPQNKKRNIVDYQVADCHNRDWDVLLPLRNEESYQQTPERPLEALYEWDRRPLAADNRIVQLPPREATSYAGSQARVQMADRQGLAEYQSCHRAPREHFQIPLLSQEASRQPQSLLRSHPVQPLYDYASPTLVKASKSATSYRNVINPSLSSRHAPSMNAGEGGSYTGSYITMDRSQRFENAGRQWRSEFRKLSINDRQAREHQPGMRDGPTTERFNYAYLQNAPREIHVPSRSDAEGHERGSEQYRERAVNDNSLQTRSVHQEPFFYDQHLGASDQHFRKSGQHSQTNVEPQRPNSFEIRAAQPVLRPAVDQWNRKSHSWNQASHVGFEHGLPVANRSNGYIENVRPVSLSYNDPRQIERRAPREVVVLE